MFIIAESIKTWITLSVLIITRKVIICINVLNLERTIILQKIKKFDEIQYIWIRKVEMFIYRIKKQLLIDNSW